MASIIDIFSSSFQQYSIAWIIISGVIGAFLTASTKFVFEHTLPEWQLKRATRIAIQKYSFPLLRSARDLEATIKEVLFGTRWNDSKDYYFRLRALYLFGRFFGWCKILSNESVLEYVERAEIIKSKNVQMFAKYYAIIFKGISNVSYFLEAEDISFAERESARIPALVISCIGDLMVKEATQSKEAFSNIITFLEFTRYYQENPEFKKWFSYLENLLSDIKKSETNAKWNRLTIFHTNLCVFIDFLNKNNKKSAIYERVLQIIRNSLPLHHEVLPNVIRQDKTFQKKHRKVENKMVKDSDDLGYKISYT